MIKTTLTTETKCSIQPNHHCTICYKKYCKDCLL